MRKSAVVYSKQEETEQRISLCRNMAETAEEFDHMSLTQPHQPAITETGAGPLSYQPTQPSDSTFNSMFEFDRRRKIK